MARDPRTLAQGHQIFPRALRRGLLLGEEHVMADLKGLLDLIDHYVPLLYLLQAVWEGLDLQEDDDVVDTFSNYAQDQTSVLADMATESWATRKSIGAIGGETEGGRQTKIGR